VSVTLSRALVKERWWPARRSPGKGRGTRTSGLRSTPPLEDTFNSPATTPKSVVDSYP
jgi:hypothetical protein